MKFFLMSKNLWETAIEAPATFTEPESEQASSLALYLLGRNVSNVYVIVIFDRNNDSVDFNLFLFHRCFLKVRDSARLEKNRQ